MLKGVKELITESGPPLEWTGYFKDHDITFNDSDLTIDMNPKELSGWASGATYYDAIIVYPGCQSVNLVIKIISDETDKRRHLDLLLHNSFNFIRFNFGNVLRLNTSEVKIPILKIGQLPSKVNDTQLDGTVKSHGGNVAVLMINVAISEGLNFDIKMQSTSIK